MEFFGNPGEKLIRNLAQSELIIPDDGIEAEFAGAVLRILQQENEKRLVNLLEKADNKTLTATERDELRSLLPAGGGSVNE